MGIYKVPLLLNEREDPPVLISNLRSCKINSQSVKFYGNLSADSISEE